MTDVVKWDMTEYLPDGPVNVRQMHAELSAIIGPALDGVMFFDEGDGVRGLAVMLADADFAQGYHESIIDAIVGHVPEQPPPVVSLEERVAALERQLATALALLNP